MGPENTEELRQPFGVCRPCRCRYKLPIHMCPVNCNINILATRSIDIRTHCGVSTAGLALEHTGCCQKLGRMADGGNRFVCFTKMPDDTQNFFIQPNVPRGSSAGDDKGVVFVRLHIIKICIKCQLCPRFSL